MLNLIAQGSDVFGEITKPVGVAAIDQAAGGDLGIILFASNIIRLTTVVAGLWVLYNFVTAGFDYITAGDSKANQKVKEKLTSSILGLVIIVASYTLMGLIGYLFFGDAGYILSPTLCGPAGCDAPPAPPTTK